MRQGIVENCVFGIKPFAVADVAIAKHVEKIGSKGVGPLLEERKMPLSRAAREVMPARLQQKRGIKTEAQRAVRSIHLFFDDDMPARKLRKRHGLQVLIAWL